MGKQKKDEVKQTDPRMVRIGEKIKKLRIEKGYTNYEAMAWDSGIGRMQYWRLEKGANITMASFFKVLDFHKISLEEFFVGFDQTKKS